MIAWLQPDTPFPPIESALEEPNGLLAAGGDLSPQRLLSAYRQGIFPWYSDDQPILWWSPDPRMVLFIDEFKVSRSLSKLVRRGRFEIRVDTVFRRVISECATARPGQGGTWITSEIIDAYSKLHHMGYAHSFEAWDGGELVGGLYGIALGHVFFGESMFTRTADASKVALWHLVRHLRASGFVLIDCQQETAHLASFGARPIPRKAFAEHLGKLINSSPWTAPTDLETHQGA